MCIFTNISLKDNLQYAIRLVHQDDSLADLTMISASSVDATLPREEQELLERQEEQQQEQEKETQALVVVMPNTDATACKTKSLSDHRQSSTDESHYCSAGTEQEPSTEQSSGTISPRAQRHAFHFYLGVECWENIQTFSSELLFCERETYRPLSLLCNSLLRYAFLVFPSLDLKNKWHLVIDRLTVLFLKFLEYFHKLQLFIWWLLEIHIIKIVSCYIVIVSVNEVRWPAFEFRS